MDCGGVYLVAEDTGALELVFHTGLSADFVSRVCRCEADSVKTQLVMTSKPTYAEYQQLGISLGADEDREGLRAIAVLPFLHKGEVIGCLNIASHVLQEVPAYSRTALETIAAQIGDTIARLKTEEILRESEERYRQLVSTTTDAVMLFDPETRQFVDVNKTCEEFYGYSREEFLDLRQQDITAEPEESDGSIKETLAGRLKKIPVRYHRKKDGTVFPVEISASTFEQGGRRVVCGVIRDITERKQAEDALREAHEQLEERVRERTGQLEQANESLHTEIAEHKRAEEQLVVFRKFAEASEQALGMADLEGNITYANPTLCRILGAKEPQEIHGTNVADYYLKQDLPNLQNQILPAVIEQGYQTVEIPLLSRTGETTAVIQSIFLIRDDQGKPFRLANVITDITERKQAEEELRRHRDQLEEMVAERTSELTRRNEELQQEITERKQAEQALAESEARFRATFEQAAVGIAHVALDGRFIRINRKLCDIVGYTRDEMLARTFQDITHPDDLDADLDYVRQVLAGEIDAYSMEKRYFRNNASVVWVNLTVALLREESGEPKFFISVVEDITGRKQAEEALRKSEEKFYKAFHSSPEAITISTLETGRFVAVNEGLTRMLGYTPDEIIGKTSTELRIWAVAKDRNEKTERLNKDGKIRDLEIQLRHKSGEIRDVVLSAEVIELEGEDCSVAATKDITERKRAERALRESETRYRAIVEDQIELICRNLADSTITFVNEAYCRCFDRSREELVGHKFMPLIPEADRAKVKEHFATLGPDRPVATHEHRVIMPDGRVRWQQWTNRAIFDDAVNIIEFQRAGRDVTEPKKAQEALQQSEQKYRSLIANIPDVVWTSDEKGNTIYISANVEDIFGYSPEEIYSQGDRLWFGRIHPDDLERVVKEAFKAVFDEGKRLDVEYRIRRKDGQWIWIQDRSIGAYEKDGVKYADGVFFDVTERKQAEEALRESEETAAALLNATSDAALLIDGQGGVIAVNRSMAESLGTTPEEIVGTVIYDYLPPDLAEQRMARGVEAAHTRSPVRFEDQRAGRWLENSVFPILTPQGEVSRYAIYSRDVTERKQAERALRESEERFRTLFESAPDAIYLNDLEGHFVDGNRAAEELAGLGGDWV